MKYLALLRGINVGGKNLIGMAALRFCLEQLPLNNVSTYIQSGNVLFESRQRDPLRLSAMIEKEIADQFGVAPLVVILTGQQLDSIVTQAPPGFGAQPAKYRYDVAFLKPPVTATDVLPTVRLKDGVDRAFAANDVLYFQRLEERRNQSYLSKLVMHPAYKTMTLRNWQTTTRLQRLIHAAKP